MPESNRSVKNQNHVIGIERPAVHSHEPGAKRGGAAIYDANRYLLSTLLERLGAVVTDLGFAKRAR